MPPRSITIAAAAVVGIIVILVAGLFIFDASRADIVSKGVEVGEVDIGGLSRADAHKRLEQRLLKPLNAPLVVRAADKEFPLSAREAQIKADVDGMVGRAIQRSREGGALARTWRAISGAEVNATITPDIAYSRPAVQRLVDRVRVAVSKKPVDAKVDFGPDNVTIRHAQIGRTIDTKRLRANVQQAIAAASTTRTLTIPVTRLKPKVMGSMLAKEYPVIVTVDRGHFRISLFKRLKHVKTYPIAVGQAGLETPAGLYKIQNKAVNPAWTVPNSSWAGSLAGQVIPGGIPSNPLKARWLGVYDGVGVHGTDARGSIGTNASHGCIRMLVEDVTELYDEVPVGTPIYIA